MISFVTSIDQSLDGSSINVGVGTNRVLFVGVLSRGTDATGVNFNTTEAMTKVCGITTNTVSADDKFSLWVLANPTSGSHAIQTVGTSGTVRVTALAINGGHQTTPFNTSNEKTEDFPTTAPHSSSITTQYTNSWLVAFVPNVTFTPIGDANTTFPNANTYVMAYSPTAQTVGSNALGHTNDTASVFLLCEAMSADGTLGGSAPLSNLLNMGVG